MYLMHNLDSAFASGVDVFVVFVVFEWWERGLNRYRNGDLNLDKEI